MKDLPRDARFVCDGLVLCPVRRTDIELDSCLRCPWLRDAESADRPRYIRCRPPWSAVPPVGVGRDLASRP